MANATNYKVAVLMPNAVNIIEGGSVIREGYRAGTIDSVEVVDGKAKVVLDLDDEFGKLQKPPRATGGIGTQSPYVIVEDVDAHYARARAAGARIFLDIEDKDYGGRGYTCLDPEGHVWSFGSFDPWETS